jgi:tRNA nucleotidyltransferase (CCA-adding enzyme)
VSAGGPKVSLDAVPAEARRFLEAGAEVADRRNERLAWVGGGVRDLLLGRGGLDLDLVLEGDPEAFARDLAGRLDGEVRLHPRFLTATLALPAAARLDIARARRERYAAPAVLPEVEPASLDEDLARRDFTINALAVTLAPGVERGTLGDPAGGRRDLEAGLLRALHPGSFVDDPTRLLRGLRFALRFAFRFEAATASWARAAVADGIPGLLSGSRLAHDLQLLFDDRPEIDDALAALAEMGLTGTLAPALADRERVARAVRLCASVRAEAARLASHLRVQGWRLALLSIAATAGEPLAAALAARLALPGAERDLVLSGPSRVARAVRHLAPASLPHEAAELLAPLCDEELTLAAASGPAPATWVQRWLEELRDLRLAVTGEDLVAAGVPPGPRLGAALRATRRARQDGLIDRAGELDFALRRSAGEEEPG